MANDKCYRIEIKWKNVLMFAYLHIAAVYGLMIPVSSKYTRHIVTILGLFPGFGTTVAAHRYFTHRTFKANKILKIILIYLQTAAGQEPIVHWARDHRLHHKCNTV